jgi:hypothetical protein
VSTEATAPGASTVHVVADAAHAGHLLFGHRPGLEGAEILAQLGRGPRPRRADVDGGMGSAPPTAGAAEEPIVSVPPV